MARDYSQLFAICNTHGFDYKEMVYEFTEGRTDSLTKLSDGEFKELMIRLTRLNAPARQQFTPPPGDRQRKKIIAIARDMRWDARGNAIMMQRIDDFLINRSKYGKRLNDLTVDELNKVCFIFENEVKVSFLKGLNR
ncbi:Uncharacterised protein [Sphingobacterium spiritivorum]|uniref:Uncharacterized protein n=1 Tax=Sphingobacterium spiritivorum TaxID=258 RepID=A0A380CRE2_SPHSI|nr:hypothetical protein [Sphingobacterium spiritivorum]SUJ26419.1 Uncharacterised protein [Sphingobacterium spiritivorum]